MAEPRAAILPAGRIAAAPLEHEIAWDLAPLPDDPVDPDPTVDAVIEAMAYREVTQAAIHALADCHRQCQRLRFRRREHIDG